MASENNYLSEELNFSYYCVKGCYDVDDPRRMSPSSWDDSDEEQESTDANSSFDTINLKERKFCNTFVINESLEEEEDRRQSLARVRRRTKDFPKSSLVLPQTNVRSFTVNHFMAWNDQDRDYGTIFETEKHFNSQNFPKSFLKGLSLYQSKASNTKSNNKCRKDSGGNENLHNLNVRLSRIVEDEYTPYWSLWEENSDPTIFQMNSYKRPAEEKVTRSSNNEVKFTLSTEDDVEMFKDRSEGTWNGILSRIKKNSEYAVNCEDSEHVDSAPKYIYREEESLEKANKEKTRNDNFEEDGLYCRKQISRDSCESTAKIEGGEEFQSFREVNSVEGRNDVEDKISIDKVENVSDCSDTTYESGTPRRHGNLTGREKDHAPSKESLELGLENLFSLTRPTFSTPSTSNNHHDTVRSTSYDLIRKNECFFEEVSPSCRNRDTFSNLTTRSRESSLNSHERHRTFDPENIRALSEISSYENIGYKDFDCEVFPTFLRKNPSDRQSFFGNEPKIDESNKGSIQGQNKSKSSFLHELEMQDNFSTTDMKILGGSSSETESTKNDEKSPSSIIHKLSKTGKSAATGFYKTDDTVSNRNRVSLCEKFGFGDNEWNTVGNTRDNMDIPQDRGDMKFESYSVKSEWGRLIVQLDERCRINKPVESVFRVDVQENQRSNTSGFSRERNAEKPVKSFVTFSKGSTKDRGGTWKKAKAKKRKEVIAFTDYANMTGTKTSYLSYKLNQPTKRNWLNTFTAKKNVLTRGTRSLKAFLLMRGRGQNHRKRRCSLQNSTSHFIDSPKRSRDCFRTLFQQFVNFFTVFRNKNRN